MSPILHTIQGDQLSDAHFAQINAAEQREFGMSLPARPELGDRLYFLLLEGETLLACGYLKPITPVIFNRATFTFLNIGGIIANEKGQGYGKQIMLAIRAYLLAHDQTGLGFCHPHNQGFYEKCGFRVDSTATHRFIYHQGAQQFTAEGQYILYLESSDRFMAKVLADDSAEVSVPDPSIW